MGVVGVDVGGTSVKAGVAGHGGTVLLRQRVATPRDRGHRVVVETVLATVDRLLAAATREGCEVEAVGLAVLGTVDEDEGIARRSAAVGWCDVPLRELVTERVPVPVVLGHDVRAAAMAEATMGAGRGYGDVLFLCLGTGLAAVQVVDGRVVSGASWRAAEIGQLPVTDGSGGRTSLEGVASAQALARRYAHDADRPVVGTDAAAVVDAVARGDAVASQVFDDSLRHLAETLAVVVTFADPAIVIIGGGLSMAGTALFEPLEAGLAAALGWREPPPLVPARFGDEAGWVGAALLAWRRAGHPDGRFLAGVWP